MLAQLAVDHKVTPRAQFVAIGPRLNRRVAVAFRLYGAELIEPSALKAPDADNRVAFVPLTLEAVIEAIAAAGAGELAGRLWRRYLDFHRIYDLALASDLSSFGSNSAPAPSSSKDPPPDLR